MNQTCRLCAHAGPSNAKPGPASDDHANVRLPPPAMHGVALLSGAALSALFPLGPPMPAWLTWLGWCLLLLSLLIAGWAFREFALRRNPVPPNQPIKRLMTEGPFRFTRNPLYLALALLHAGIGLISGNVWILLTLPPTLLIVRYYVIAREEAYLVRRFGALYLDYLARVRRWI